MIPANAVALAAVQSGGAASFTVDLPASQQDVDDWEIDPTNAAAGWRCLTNGTVAARQGGGPGSYVYNHDWGTPTGGTPGNDYDVMATLNSGTNPGSTGTWLALTINRTWSLSQTSIGSKTCNLTISIRPAGGGATINSQTYTITATVDSGA